MVPSALRRHSGSLERARTFPGGAHQACLTARGQQARGALGWGAGSLRLPFLQPPLSRLPWVATVFPPDAALGAGLRRGQPPPASLSCSLRSGQVVPRRPALSSPAAESAGLLQAPPSSPRCLASVDTGRAGASAVSIATACSPGGQVGRAPWRPQHTLAVSLLHFHHIAD